MSTGISMPPRIVNGRLALESKGSQTRKVIMIAVGSDESENPWSEAGAKLPLFDLNTPEYRASLIAKIERHFRRFEGDGRASLVSVSFRPSRSGTLLADVTYKDLVDGAVRTASVEVQ